MKGGLTCLGTRISDRYESKRGSEPRVVALPRRGQIARDSGGQFDQARQRDLGKPNVSDGQTPGYLDIGPTVNSIARMKTTRYSFKNGHLDQGLAHRMITAKDFLPPTV